LTYDLSIIVPFYNAEKFIIRNFYSCLKISKNINAEIIYIDNLSKDNSYIKIKEKIKNFQNFSIFKTTKKTENSPGIARNIGIRNAKSKYIVFLDIDDELVLKNLKFNKYIKNNKSNIIYIKKKEKRINKNLVDDKTQFIKFSKSNLSIFFKKSINRAAISIIFNKNFILKHKIFFQKGFYEDIFFTFKAHFYNTKKINILNSIIYKRHITSNSITNSRLYLDHLKYMFLAWKNINDFLQKKLSKKEYENIKKSIQFRLRGEFVNEYNKILNENTKQEEKKKFLNFIVNKYKSLIIPNYKVLTKKDKITKSVLKI
jgi:glycosyltransferase involved in cell wall biosynthesis